MDYYNWVQEIIDDIEDNIKEKIDIEELIRKSFYSKTHFYRIFNAIVGCSIAEYIKKRRLSCAITKLFMTKQPIIEIALEYGFASQEVFTRNCQKEYNITPGKLRSNKQDIVLYQKINVKERIEEKRHLLNNYRIEIVVNCGYHLIGYDSVVKPGSDSIKQLWNKFMENRFRIMDIDSNIVVGVCEFAPDITDNDDFNYFFGASVKENFQKLSYRNEGFIHKEITASKYAKIYYNPTKHSLKETYNIFYGIWLPITQYRLEPKDTIEVYHLESDCMEICIPIK